MSPPNYPYGTAEYFPDLLNRVQDALPSQTIDPVLLEALLLALASGPRHLCIRTDAASIPRVAAAATSLLAAVFGYPAHPVDIRARESASGILRTLLLQPQEPAEDPFATWRPASKRTHTDSAVLFADAASSFGHARATHSSDLGASSGSDAMTLASSRRPQLASAAVPGARTLAVVRSTVATGLERAGLPAQRALLQALVDGRVELDADERGVWPLPADFVLVYVCEADPRERPAVHRGLVDMFAFAAEIHLPPARAKPRDARAASGASTLSTDAGAPVVSPAELAHLRALCVAPSAFAPRALAAVVLPPALALYAADLLALARHAPALDGALLTRRAHADLAAFARARRVLRGDGGGGALVRAAAAEVRAIEREATSMTSADAGAGTVRESGEWMHVGGKAAPEDDGEPLPPPRAEIWEVSDADVRAALPAVVRHRLRVRDGPEAEVLGSLLFPASAREDVRVPSDERRTVEEILQDILEDRDVSLVP